MLLKMNKLINPYERTHARGLAAKKLKFLKRMGKNFLTAAQYQNITTGGSKD